MIKTDGNIFYMTFGEGCYIAEVINGRLAHAHFGARVEPEDSVTALVGESDFDEFVINSGLSDGGPKNDDFELNVAVDTDSGERLKSRFVFKSAEVIEKPELSLPSLRGGKTLKIELFDNGLGLSATLLYTPFSRGGIARSVAVKNVGMRKLRFRASAARTFVYGKNAEFTCGGRDFPMNFVGVEGGGEAYGMFMLYGGVAVMASGNVNGGVELDCEVDPDIVLAPGMSFCSPEVLLCYSNAGRGGMSRVYHDILREYLIPSAFASTRRPVTVVSADAGDISHVPELGVDAYTVVTKPGDTAKKYSGLAGELKNGGMLFGARLDITKYDLKSAADAEKAHEYCRKFISGTTADIVSLEARDDCSYPYRVALYALYKALNEEFDVILIGRGDPALMKYCHIVVCGDVDTFTVGSVFTVMPPCVVARSVGPSEVSLKSRFDIASLGALNYNADVAETENIRRAVRAQVFSYQDDSSVIVGGDLYGLSVESGDIGYVAVSKDKSKAYAVVRLGKKKTRRVRFSGLDERNIYRVRELDRAYSGAALCHIGIRAEGAEGETVTFHLRQVADFD